MENATTPCRHRRSWISLCDRLLGAAASRCQLPWKLTIGADGAASRQRRQDAAAPWRLRSLCAGLSFFVCGFIQGSCPAHAAEPDCRELERTYAVERADLTAIQRNALLFTSAARDCGALALRLIADGASLQSRNRMGAMPLALAARGGHAALVERFLSLGAAIDARDLAGGTALYGAVESQRPTTVAALLKRGANPDLTGRSDLSPLAAAAFRGNDRIVELLLARGAEADHVDATGKSPIVYAAARGFALVVRRLLDAGVDAKARYGNDLTALMWAAGHDDGVGSGAAIEVAELLIEHGAVIDAADNRSRTALMMAAERGDAAMAAALLKHGASRALRDKAGKTACDLSAGEAVRALGGC